MRRDTRAVCLFCGLVVLGCTPAAPTPVPADAMARAPRRLAPEATVEHAERGRASVTSPVWGTVTRVLVQVGARVRASDPLLEIETPPPPDLGAARAGILAAEHTLRRMEDLHERGEPQRDVDVARCALERARRELDRARRGPGDPRTTTVVRATADGEVRDLYVAPGTIVEGAEIPECTPSTLVVEERP